MKPEQQIVTQLPLHELWNRQGSIGATRVRNLGVEDITGLLRLSPVYFVVADAGLPLEWVPPKKSYQLWKSEVKLRIVEPNLAKQGFELRNIPDEHCYLASEWQADYGQPIILLEKYH